MIPPALDRNVFQAYEFTRKLWEMVYGMNVNGCILLLFVFFFFFARISPLFSRIKETEQTSILLLAVSLIFSRTTLGL